MVYKKVKRSEGDAAKVGKAKKSQVSFKNKTGIEASKRMQEKLSMIKKNKKDDEEIMSADSGDEATHIKAATREGAMQKKKNQILNDPFLQLDDAQDIEAANKMEQDQIETAEEKRLRMANQIIKEYGKDEKNDFFEQLHAKTQMEE